MTSQAYDNDRILDLQKKIKDETYLKDAIHRIAHVLSNKLIEDSISIYEREQKQ